MSETPEPKVERVEDIVAEMRGKDRASHYVWGHTADRIEAAYKRDWERASTEIRNLLGERTSLEEKLEEKDAEIARLKTALKGKTFSVTNAYSCTCGSFTPRGHHCARCGGVA